LAGPQLLDSGRCDYILFEALAEITMGILTRARRRDASLGYATDIIEMIGRDIAEYRRQNIGVITNAGGVNPAAAAARLHAIAREAGVPIRVATVTGDDLMTQLDVLREAGVVEMRSGAPVPQNPMSMNAYLGARPIAAALGAGANVVITGRCVDSALTLGPLIHEFAWRASDHDLLSQGSLAGHLLECGPQSTGGLLTDWDDVPSCEDLGYPLAECRPDGSFVLTKPEGSGGVVDRRTVSEQLLYEVGDPSRYLLPDVTCDWRHVALTELGNDRVLVEKARGRRPPTTLKACAQVLDGYKVKVLLFLGGRDAVRKAERLGADVLKRAERVLVGNGFAPLRASDIEVLGSESTYGPHGRARGAREVLLKVGLHHDERSALSKIVREIPSFALAMPGLTGGGSGLARPTPLLRLKSFLIPRSHVLVEIEMEGKALVFEEPAPHDGPSNDCAPLPDVARFHVAEPVVVPLVAVAHARSGDKGADANIGVRARHPDFLPLLRDQLTAEVVGAWFAHRIDGVVERFELPGIDALNFLLRDALGGGGVASLRFDTQGKAYAQQLLDMPLEVPARWLEHDAFRAAVPID
jgi:hypothetical protein